MLKQSGQVRPYCLLFLILEIFLRGTNCFYLMIHSTHCYLCLYGIGGARCSSVIRTFAHGAMGRRIDPSWGGPIELFLVPASAPQFV